VTATTPARRSGRRPRGGAAKTAAPVLPSTARVGLSRGILELKSFFRQRESVVFTFSLPVILLVLFGEIFHGTVGHTGVSFRQYFTAGIIASGIMSATFVNLGVGIVMERDEGVLKRLVGTPMPKSAYFIGKAVCAVVVAVLETAILLAIGVAFLGLSLPASAGRWLTFGWVFGLGVVTCSMAGIATSSLARTARSATAVLTLPYLVLSFISGVYFVFSSLPQGLQEFAAVFPLKWLCQGLRSVFLPDSLLPAEPAHSWQHGETALVLAAWLVASLVVCVRTFRWLRPGEK
jgi:ABC-2 type transport system permease protein